MRKETCDPSLPPAPRPGAGFGVANDNTPHLTLFIEEIIARLVQFGAVIVLVLS